MLVYRITHKSYSKELFASGIKGRWNGVGKKVIYCADSIALAFLENMVRRQGAGFNDDFKIMIVEIPDDLNVTVLNIDDLKDGWREFEDYSKCQPLGDHWYDEGKTTVLKVPSAVLPDSSNYVINSTHPDYKKIQLLDVTDLIPDKRIDDILKKYPKK
jgi:RES domain-containing protein